MSPQQMNTAQIEFTLGQLEKRLQIKRREIEAYKGLREYGHVLRSLLPDCPDEFENAAVEYITAQIDWGEMDCSEYEIQINAYKEALRQLSSNLVVPDLRTQSRPKLKF